MNTELVWGWNGTPPGDGRSRAAIAALTWAWMNCNAGTFHDLTGIKKKKKATKKPLHISQQLAAKNFPTFPERRSSLQVLFSSP